MKYWLLLRGLGRCRHHWGDFGQKFQQAIGDDKIIYLDILGNGDMHSQYSCTNIQDNTENLRSRLAQLFIKSNAALSVPKLNFVSISMGAMIATDWASRYPSEVESLHIINTSDSGSSPFYRRLRFENYPKLIRLLTKTDDAEIFEKGILEITTNNFSERELWHKKFAQVPITQRKNWLRQIIAASSYSFPKQAPNCRTQIIVSETDRLVSSTCSQSIAKMWQLPLTTHPTAGHDLPLEASQWLIEKILT